MKFDSMNGYKQLHRPLAIFQAILAVVCSGPLAASTIFSQNESGPKEPVEARISLDHREFHLGELVELRLEISNLGHESLLIPNSVSLFVNADALVEIELRGKKGLLSARAGFSSACFTAPGKNPKTPSEIILNSFLALRPRTSYVQRLPLYEILNLYGLTPGSYTLKIDYFSNDLLNPSDCGTHGLTENDLKSLPFKTWHGKVSTNKLSFTVLPPD
jgi:hypothetical protein